MSQESVTVERMGGQVALQREAAFKLIYAEVFAEPPYREADDDVTATFRRFQTQARKSTFLAGLARAEGGEPVGMAYGYPLGAKTGWWDQLIEPVADDLRREDGRRTFGLMELAVRAPWRRRGIARRLHETLLGGVTAERVLLNVHPESAAALAAYRSWGYRKVGETRPWDGACLHDVMLLDLRGATSRPERP
ncbi:GNAT family N-acetyltransferase [Streptomyces pharetrae CZA14]|uniref:GNAT family N-acetyltransferase n=1 Tax=Streptomyces pharetrae CZA14 TaxID=1144883 RepID=A0ABX3YPN7_9ACTN|nr:GNAT family N-acetyltransferase [Streptomyces pharetrae CZA14]